jgi:hypothetical protein
MISIAQEINAELNATNLDTEPPSTVKNNMKKQAKAQKVPEIYQGLVRSNESAKTKICIDLEGEVYKYDTACPLVTRSIAHNWPGWDGGFDKQGKEDILEWHKKLFKVEPPKNQDLTDTSLMCYLKLVSLAKDRTSEAGEKLVKKEKKIMSREYWIPEGADPSVIQTPQAKVCFAIVYDATEKGTKHITEEELRKHVYARGGELKTRQDEWRIFQYYRPMLVQKGVLKHS